MKKVTILLVTFFLVAIAHQPKAVAYQVDVSTEVIDVAQSQKDVPEMLPLVESNEVKNVILIIGDGTGLSQITTGQYALVGPDGYLHIQTMPVAGFVKTHSSDNLITDSASGATAYSCGIKTYNGAIGMSPDKEKCKTILELAEEKGLSTGLVSTSSITHATPASFASHVEKRSMQEEIAAQFLHTGVDVFLGGGMKFFDARQREDSQDLIGKFKDAGYQVVMNEKELDESETGHLLGLFAEDGMEREKGEPASAKMTKKALEILSRNEEGFFLMLEGSQIDWAGHSNEVEYLINEVRDFDEAVKTVLDFAREDGETLVVLTADHETGGMVMLREQDNGDKLEVAWTTGKHTGTPVPLMAYGPAALEFTGWRDNTYIGIKLVELLKLGEFPVLLNE